MKPRLFFFHSNGFPARTYGHFLKTLETWNPEAINILGADLSSFGGIWILWLRKSSARLPLRKERDWNRPFIGRESLCPGPGFETEFIPEYDFARSPDFHPVKKKCHPLAPQAGDSGMVQSFKEGPTTTKHLCQQEPSPGVFCSQTFISGLSPILT